MQQEKRRQWSLDAGGNDIRALSDANSISTSELSKLIEYYRGSRPNTIRWRDFVADFAGISTGSGSLHRQSGNSDPDVDPLEQQLRRILAVLREESVSKIF